MESSNPFKQANYHYYKRDFVAGINSVETAISLYRDSNQKDSLALSLAYKAKLSVLKNDLKGTLSSLDECRQVMSDISDTIPLTMFYYYGGLAGHSVAVYNFDEAENIYKEAIKYVKKHFGTCSHELCSVLTNYTILNLYKYEHKEAEKIAEKMIACAKEIYKETDMRQMPHFSILGAIKQNLGYSQEALNYYEKAMKLVELNLGKNSYIYSRLLSNAANQYYEKGEVLKAISLFQESIKIAEQFDDFSGSIPTAYYNIANYFFSMGYRHKAKSYLHKAISSLPKDHDEPLPDSYLIFQLLSHVEFLLDNNEEGERYLKKAINHITNYYGDGYEAIADVLRRKAYLHTLNNEHEKALELLEENIRLFDKYNWDALKVGRSDDYAMASQEALALEDTLKALNYLKYAINDLDHAPPNLKLEESWALEKLANIYIFKGQLDSAEYCIERAMKIVLRDTFNYKLLHTYSLKEYKPYDYLEDILNGKIKLLTALYEKNKNIRYLETAINESEVLLSIFQKTTSTYLEGGDAIERLNLYWPYYETALNTFSKYFNATGNKEAVKRAISVSEQTKDIIHKMAAQSASANTTLGLSDSLLKIEEKYTFEIEEAEESIYNSFLDSLPKDSIDILENKLFELEREFDVFKENLSKEFPKYHQSKYVFSQLNFDIIQDYLRKNNAVILNYFIGDINAHLFIIDSDKFYQIQLSDPNVISTIAERAIKSLRSIGELNPLKELYNEIVAEAIPIIGEKSVIVIPDGKLNFIPFEALINEKGNFLVENYDISYSNSLQAFYSNSTKKVANNILAIAPGFSKSTISHTRKHLTKDALEYSMYLPQPNAIKLIKSLKAKASGTFLIDLEAKESAFKHNIDHNNLLILATHAEVNDANPLYSRITFIPDSLDDGPLYAYEIFGLDLDYSLAILTACETGTGKLDRGQGAASLAHAFRYAGCNSIVMTLWSIDEKESSKLVFDFFERLQSGENKRNALSSVKRGYLASKSGRLRHPYYWAGLVLIGDTTPISDKPTSMWMIFGLIVLLAAIFVISRNMRK